jgi:hypothetical protein
MWEEFDQQLRPALSLFRIQPVITCLESIYLYTCARLFTYFICSLQNPTLGVLVAEGDNVLGRQRGLWPPEWKVWGIVPKAAWRRGGNNNVANDPFGEPGSTPWHLCLPPAWRSAGGYWGSCGINMDQIHLQEKMAKALAEFKFCRLGKHFYGTYCDEIPLC